MSSAKQKRRIVDGGDSSIAVRSGAKNTRCQNHNTRRNKGSSNQQHAQRDRPIAVSLAAEACLPAIAEDHGGRSPVIFNRAVRTRRAA